MNIKFLNNFIFDIYVKKELLKDVNFNNKNNLEDYLKNLFKVLKSYYNLEIKGFYEITVYIDKYYGAIFHFEKDDLEYYDCLKNQVDMRIIRIDTDFLYLVEDIPFNLLKKVDVFINDNKIYLKINKDLTNLEMMKLLENSIIIYDIL